MVVLLITMKPCRSWLRVAVSHAQAGADMIAPSNMMDGYVKAIREALDALLDLKIFLLWLILLNLLLPTMARSVQMLILLRLQATAKGYQMDPANSDEALREVALDIEEGADIVMVKPALAFLDIVQRVHETFNRPLCVYNVSGEYAMVKAAAQKRLD